MHLAIFTGFIWIYDYCNWFQQFDLCGLYMIVLYFCSVLFGRVKKEDLNYRRTHCGKTYACKFMMAVFPVGCLQGLDCWKPKLVNVAHAFAIAVIVSTLDGTLSMLSMSATLSQRETWENIMLALIHVSLAWTLHHCSVYIYIYIYMYTDIRIVHICMYVM